MLTTWRRSGTTTRLAERLERTHTRPATGPATLEHAVLRNGRVANTALRAEGFCAASQAGIISQRPEHGLAPWSTVPDGVDIARGANKPYTTPSKECDVVMKGGITSGVVYPRAACHLAKTYRFRQVGGASAGAIAAAFVAAAEHGRSAAPAGGQPAGFERLHALPEDLGDRLATLFQPSPSTRPAFGLLMAWLEPGWGVARKLAATVWRLVRNAPVAAFLGFAVIAAPAFWNAVVRPRPPETGDEWVDVLRAVALWLPLSFLVALLAAAAWGIRRTLRELPGNGFGLCIGHRDGSSARPPLTDWMTDEIDALAGRSPDGAPLSLGDLWGAEATELSREMYDYPDKWFAPDHRRLAVEKRNVDLQVMTTNLTFRRPYRFPFDQRIWYFCERRMRDYFPTRLVDHLVKTSKPAAEDGGVSMRCPCHDELVRSLPAPPDIPVVMAARLSLSFPGLISAVPLLTVDRSRDPAKQNLIDTWFSDGGIASNFPVHLFDGFWPRRPTFAINLQPPHPDYPDQLVWKAEPGAAGIVPRAHPMASMTGFASAVLDTMQNWVDATQITQPGHRDRIVEVRHTKSEGGINLKMDRDTILGLANRGAQAAAKFDGYDFDLHRWIRYRVEMNELDTLFEGLLARYTLDGYEQFVATTGLSAERYRHDRDADGPRTVAGADIEATKALLAVVRAWRDAKHPASKGTVPRPRPALRIVPRQ